jgi:transcriptional regulator with XRE-family HTH domain
MARGDGYDTLYEALGQRVAQARISARLSQGKLAERVGVTRASIVNIERGRQRPPLHLLWQIAAAANVDLLRLIPKANELEMMEGPIPLDTRVVASIERAASNNPGARRALAEFISRATSTFEEEHAEREESRDS